MDAEDLGLAERMAWEEAVDAFPDLGQERLHRREPTLFVLPAMRLEPFATLNAGEGAEEPPVAVGEALESGRCGARGPRHVAAQYVEPLAGTR